MHDSAMAETAAFADRYLTDSPMRVADIGSHNVNGSTKQLFRGHAYVGFDIQAGPGVDVLMFDHNRIPASDASFDICVSANTLEHARQPWSLVKEMGRILRPGGVAFLLAPMPNAHPWHGNPIDCWRCYTEGMRGLFEYAGLEVMDLHEAGHHDTVGIGRKP